MANDRQQRAARAEQMRKDREKADRRQRSIITTAIVLVLVVLVAVAGFAIKNVSDQNATDDRLNVPANTTEDYGIVYQAADAEDPVSVELFEDFQCPACRQFEAQSSAFLKQAVESGDVAVTYRPYSFLDQTGGSPNEYSHRSTNMALCALDQGGVDDYVKVHDYLYLNQPQEGTPGPEDAELIEAAKTLGITGIDSCVKTEKFGRWIDDARDAGTERGVQGTPAVFVGGEAVETPSLANLQAAITAAKSS